MFFKDNLRFISTKVTQYFQPCFTERFMQDTTQSLKTFLLTY